MRKDNRELPLTYKKSDGNYFKMLRSNGVSYPSKEYSYWHNAYHRTKLPYQQKYPSYIGVSMDDILLDYNQFVEWSREQIGFNQSGFVMDKDILGTVSGNKNYSVDTCVFIPSKLNGFFITKNSAVKHYTGVSFQQDCQKYIVSCSQLNSKNKTLARVKCPIEGYNIYRSDKIRLAKILSKVYCGLVDQRVIDVLENFDKYIDLFTINPTNKKEICYG